MRRGRPGGWPAVVGLVRRDAPPTGFAEQDADAREGAGGQAATASASSASAIASAASTAGVPVAVNPMAPRASAARRVGSPGVGGRRRRASS